MALFEVQIFPLPGKADVDEECVQQLIWQNAQAIAPTYPESNRAVYLAAAQTLRIPFWDWSVDANIPAVANVSSIQINTPNGQKTIDNPLYRYSFPPTAADTGIVSYVIW